MTEYKDWYHIGAENNGKFDLVDFAKGSTLVSLKTVNTAGSTWLWRMQRHIRDLASRGALVGGDSARMVLDIRVPPGGAAAARELIGYGEEFGVTVVISELP